MEGKESAARQWGHPVPPQRTNTHRTTVTVNFLLLGSRGKFLLSLLNYTSFGFISKFKLKQLLRRWIKAFFKMFQATEDKILVPYINLDPVRAQRRG